MNENNSPLVHRLYAGNSLRNFNYIIETQSHLWLIDPYDAEQVSDLIEKLAKPVAAIINTHEHHDHIRGNKELSQKYHAPIWAHPNAQGKIPNLTRTLSKGERIDLGGEYVFEVLDTPGHTHAHLCLLLLHAEQVKAVFTGDTLFNAGVGNCHNGGDPEVLFETIRDYFMTLPDDVLVYPGHDYIRTNLGFTLDREPSNSIAKDWQSRHQKIDHDHEFWQTKMGEEKLFNTFLRLDSQEIIDNLPGKPQDHKQVFLTLRQLRNKW